MAMGNSVWAGTGHMFKIDTYIESDTMSETSTLVDYSYETGDNHGTQITTIFRDSSPANRQAVYQNYLAVTSRASLVEPIDDAMLCSDDRAWDCPSSKAYQRAKRAMLSMISWTKRLQRSSPADRQNHSLSATYSNNPYHEHNIERSLITIHAAGQSC